MTPDRPRRLVERNPYIQTDLSGAYTDEEDRRHRMSDLPGRDTIEAALGDPQAYIDDLVALARLFVTGWLVDREAIDYEAAARWTHAEMVRRGPTDLTWESAYPQEQEDHLFLAFGAVGAALGDDKTTEELHAAAFAAAIGGGE